MAALPYMQLYIADYLADTAHLSTLEHGAYLLLIMNYWQRGHALPASNDRLARVARMSNEEWETVKDTLSEFFEIDDEQWFHHRIERDLEAVRAKSEQARMAGKASAERRKKNRNNRRSTDVPTDVKRTCNHTDTDTDTDTDTKNTPSSQGPKLKTPDVSNELATLLRKKILDNNPNAKVPSSLDGWSKAIDLMIDIDNRNPEEVRKVIEWCQSDSFWKTNILSADKLRKQYDQLFMKMNEKRSRASPPQNRHTNKTNYDGEDGEVLNADEF